MNDQEQVKEKTTETQNKFQIEKQSQSPWAVPAAIIVAGILIAGAVIYGGGNSNLNANNPSNPSLAGNNNAGIEDGGNKASASLDKIAPITKEDHILGNVNAPVKIVEYSDLECPFCKRFHETMNQVMDEYGKSGKVAWVYRHFPLDSLHSKARKEAEATECANELGGNAKFWEYANRLFELTPSNNRLELSQLPEIAKYIGLNEVKFNECLSSGKYANHISEDLANAVATGGQGTPWSILIAKDGKKFPINGALPYTQVKILIDSALK